MLSARAPRPVRSELTSAIRSVLSRLNIPVPDNLDSRDFNLCVPDINDPERFVGKCRTVEIPNPATPALTHVKQKLCVKSEPFLHSSSGPTSVPSPASPQAPRESIVLHDVHRVAMSVDQRLATVEARLASQGDNDDDVSEVGDDSFSILDIQNRLLCFCCGHCHSLDWIDNRVTSKFVTCQECKVNFHDNSRCVPPRPKTGKNKNWAESTKGRWKYTCSYCLNEKKCYACRRNDSAVHCRQCGHWFCNSANCVQMELLKIVICGKSIPKIRLCPDCYSSYELVIQNSE
ncbi:Zinc finger FYVE/FYVE-related type [Carpediemonas membranifera]|uniref:Zinc finger FYVE/FYVE-related type n=1 Tax=Carpediemonas membranifera TaxID=201153 RepID=A0A8J6E0K2_9EUKA|nr:Zinc finger FYVE/FYVE-related type [Carpediemonas membranifera]|eukprot:KAG9389452.1 Zinc finger FYVE/FYVE-related type [Carpediemonas membranifera]